MKKQTNFSPFPTLPLPPSLNNGGNQPGFSIRSATIDDAPAIARVNVDTWRTAYRNIIPAAFLANLSYEARANNWREIFLDAKNTGVFACVAENESGKIIGFAAGCPERTGKYDYRGELSAIYILEAYQRQGIGRKLVREVATKLAESNLNSMLLWVLEDNSACKFYEALGGEIVGDRETVRAGILLKELAYGWRELSGVLSFEL
ncbi:MAG: GNAT family N-acetyltransferase [Oscillatoriaceae cyanobacterium Prado104]|jgi:ribosomal protein S18 acetylase RimI-like enzyme|nr:GNAT family N-acetyltransferase [Oscillatoriaceae cyanobacterium Prado104]